MEHDQAVIRYIVTALVTSPGASASQVSADVTLRCENTEHPSARLTYSRGGLTRTGGEGEVCFHREKNKKMTSLEEA